MQPLTPYPQIVEYNEAVQHPSTAFRDPELRQGQVKLNALGLPVALSGGFALTYPMMTGAKAKGRKLAVRCFHREIPAAQHKYAAIARAVTALRSPYFVGFDYLADGIKIRGGFYPVLKMDWAEGDPLGVWLDRNSGDRRALEKLREQFAALAAFLEKYGIAHGDIQTGNVIISAAGLKLVDYDGVFVPGMPAAFGSETGHKHFQHPSRAPAHFGPAIDRFSLIAVDLSLAALIAVPSLHRRFRQGGETILFRARDFVDPDRSELFGLLQQHAALHQTAENFAAICRADFGAVPSLGDFRAGRNIPQPASGSPVAAPASRSRTQTTAPRPPKAQHWRFWPALRHGDSQPAPAPTPIRAETAPGPGRSNRHLVARLLAEPRANPGTSRTTPTPRRPDGAQSAADLAALRSPRSNRDIVRTLRPTAVAPIPSAPIPSAPRTPASVRPHSASPAPMPRSGSVVIHPHNRVAPPSPSAAAEQSPTLLRRVLRAIGVDH